MDDIRNLLEKREELRKNSSVSFLSGDGMEMFYAFNTEGDMVASGTEWAYLDEDGKLMPEYYPDGSRRENPPEQRQTVEVLYFIPAKMTLEEYDRNPIQSKNRLPLPLGYGIGRIICEDDIFTISSAKGNPDILGTFQTMFEQFASAKYSYYNKNGLAANVLSRYYYEFLAESHELYLSVEERKKHRNPPKFLENRKITAEDFKEENGEYSCECELLFWGTRATIYADYTKENDDAENSLSEFITLLNLHFQWIQENQSAIQQAILEDDMVELANDWMENFEVEDEDGKTWYETEDAGRIPCPITEEAFLSGLYIGGINVYSGESDLDMSFDVFLGTYPDFFACHDIEVFITATAEQEDSLTPPDHGQTKNNRSYRYKINVNGLAG